jgi:hypothetical protein
LVVNCTGDINGDGKNDLLVSVQRSLTSGKENGLVFLILGAQILMGGNLSTASVKWTLQSGGDFSGLNMRTGDTNSDGFDDVLIGARGNNQNGSYSGSAFLVYGNKNPTSTNLSNSLSNWYGESEYDRAGSCLGMGDIDGDGKSDLIIGSPGNKAGAYTGALNLLFGSVNLLGENLPGISTKWEGEKKLDQLGYGCTLRGDANGDGHKDIVVSAPYRNFVDTNEGMIYIIHGLGY